MKYQIKAEIICQRCNHSGGEGVIEISTDNTRGETRQKVVTWPKGMGVVATERFCHSCCGVLRAQASK